MSAVPLHVIESPENPFLAKASLQAIADKLPYAGGVSPTDAWKPVSSGLATLEKDIVILLLCRSGKRSALAAKAGFRHVFNVREGFEGDLNAARQRGDHNGWRFHRLPWLRD